MLLKVDGAISRNISGPDLVDCVRRVARGQRSVIRSGGDAAQLMDSVGARVRDRLTPKELQIVALIVQGCKNKRDRLAAGHQGAGDQELPAQHL